MNLTALDKLLKLMPPPPDPAKAPGDWTCIEQSLGLVLPADYKAYVDAYGTGSACGLIMDNPFEWTRDAGDQWAAATAMYKDYAEYGGLQIPYPLYPETGGLLPFGSLHDVHALNWLTSGDSNAWTFVFYHHTEGFREIPGLSATEFALEAITRRSPLLKAWNEEITGPIEFTPVRT